MSYASGLERQLDETNFPDTVYTRIKKLHAERFGKTNKPIELMIRDLKTQEIVDRVIRSCSDIHEKMTFNTFISSYFNNVSYVFERGPFTEEDVNDYLELFDNKMRRRIMRHWPQMGVSTREEATEALDKFRQIIASYMNDSEYTLRQQFESQNVPQIRPFDLQYPCHAHLQEFLIYMTKKGKNYYRLNSEGPSWSLKYQGLVNDEEAQLISELYHRLNGQRQPPPDPYQDSDPGQDPDQDPDQD